MPIFPTRARALILYPLRKRKNPAISYSPTKLPWQYHRHQRA
jgi:hypothetical protein